MKNDIIPYRKDLKEKARELRKDSTLSEVLLWQEIRKKQLGVQFHRQVPMLDYIVDFYCHELKLAIEINGETHEWKVNYDMDRTERLNEAGVRVIVFDDLDIKKNIKWVVNEIHSLIPDNTPMIPSRGYSPRFDNQENQKDRLLLKVCGMKHPENISGLIQLAPDFMGFIFYKKSARFVEELDVEMIQKIPSSIKKVGVFVNEQLEVVKSKVNSYQLDYVQLHGDESVEYVNELQGQGIKVIKVFRIEDEMPSSIADYDGKVELFLFDTATKNYGGSGKQFNWDLLKDYSLKTPYLLSGGISLTDIDAIETMHLNGMIGIDVNSKFEIEPAKKDLEMIGQLKEMI